MTLYNSFNSLVNIRPNNLRILSIFRLLVCFHLLKKLFFYWPYMDILYSQNSFLVHIQHRFLPQSAIDFLSTNYKIIIVLYLLLIILYILGVGKNLTAFSVWFFTLIIQQLNNGFALNGGDNFLFFILLFLSFCNTFEYYTIYSDKNKKRLTSSWFSNFNTLFFSKIIIIQLLFIYFFSGFHKMNSGEWAKGTALYYILNIQRFNTEIFINDILLKNPLLSTLSTYTVMLWELSFPFAIFINKRVKYTYLFIGVCVHLLIYFCMMIHDFELLFIFTYVLFFNDDDFENVKNKISLYATRLYKKGN